MQSYLLTPPASEPVSVAEAKTAARLTGDHWDAIVTAAIVTARGIAEHQTGRHLMAQTWRVELDDWPAADERLPYLRPTAVAVAYWDGSVWAALDSAAFVWAASDPGVVLAPALNTSWPTLGEVALGPRVRVDVTVGAASAANVPAAAKQFIQAMVTLITSDPSLTAVDALESAKYLPRILDPVRVYR